MEERNFNWYNSVSIKIPLVIMVVISITVLIFWQYNYNSLQSNVVDKTEIIVESGLSNLALNVEYTLKKISDYATDQVNDETFLSLLQEYLDAPANRKTQERSRLTLYLNQQLLNNKLIESALIVVADGDSIVTTKQGLKELPVDTEVGKRIYDQYITSRANAIGWYLDPNYLNEGEITLSYIRPMKADTRSDDNILFICHMNNNDLVKMINSVDFPESFIMISDYNGSVMLSSESERIGTNIYDIEAFQPMGDSGTNNAYQTRIDGRKYLVVYSTSLQTSWNYIKVVPIDVIYGAEKNQMYMIYFLALVSVAVSIIGSAIVMRYIIKPIRQLVGGFKQMEEGKLAALVYKKRNDEMGYMLNGYNSMVERLTSLIDELYVKELLQKEAQIRSMQSRMNEHFLHNVLNSIYCVSVKENAMETAEMIGILSRFFRMSLSQGREFVTIRDVIQLIQYYLWIQKARYGDRLVYQIDADEDIQDCYVLKYLFQPIVENSVLHGIESKQGKGTISIIFKKEDQQLHFTVTDNGVGISDEKLGQLYRDFTQHSKIKGDNFALKNINAQIKIVYGDQYGLRIDSEIGRGTKVSFEIPLKESGEETDE